MKKMRVGIIGCGTILPVHLDSISAIDELELMMVCDTKESIAKEIGKKERCKWTLDYKELIKQKDIDIIHILTPHYLHVPMAIEVLESGKHVILEKPVGISLQQMEELNRVQKKTGFTVGVTFQNRFNPTTVKAKEIIQEGLLGVFKGAKGIVTWSRKDKYYSESEWRGKLDYEGGGLLINQAIHTLDLLDYLGGKVTGIKGCISNTTHPEIEVEDSAMVTFYYEDGTFGHFFGTTSYADDSHINMEFLFNEGKLVFADQQLYLENEGGKKLLAHDLIKKGKKAYWGMSHQLIVRDIYQSISEGNQPKVSLDQAIRATELVLGTYESSKTGRIHVIKEEEV